MSLSSLRRSRSRHIGSACFEALETRQLMSFTPAIGYSAGTNPQEIVAADFNSDGRLDLVVANPTAGSVNVMPGNGNGTFQSPLSSAAGANPRSIAVGDFNADGKLDLVAVSDDSSGGSGVNVMLGNGNGTFAAPNDVAYGLVDAHSVATGDFNNDGKLDLVVTSNPALYYYPYQGQIDVLLGYGDGGFTPRQFATADRLGSVVVADMNGDGNRDIVIEMPDRTDSLVNVLLGDGHGGLSGGGMAYAQAPSAAADLTGDGKTDVIVAGGLLRGNGAGGFVADVPEQFQTGGAGPGTVALGEFDHDGRLDVAKTDGIVRYAGNGTFSSEPYVPAPTSATAVAAGDFNGDGWLDVATANGTANTVSVLLNDRNWGVTPPTVSIADAPPITEGNTGTRNATFTVTLSKPSATAVTVSYATADVFATAGSDYVAKTGTLTIPAGQTSGTLTVAVVGDRIVESRAEEFAVQLTSATNATIANARGTGRILDDEPRINIGNVSKSEGNNNKTTTFGFTVSLLTAYDQAVTVKYATANGTATAGSDYQATSGSITFAPGETSKTITIVVNGDKSKESSETFFVDLFAPSSNVFINTSRGTGTILDDDRR